MANLQAFVQALHSLSASVGYVTNTDIRDRQIIDIGVQNGYQLIGEGQNRLVFVDPQDPGFVYKIASKNEGRNDNIGEMYITYRVMKEYPELMDAFALTQLPTQVGQNLNGVDGQTLMNAFLSSSLHGLMIKQERIQCLKDVSANGRDALERLTSPQIYNGYRDLMFRIGKRFLIMDGHVKTPYQFGLKNSKLATLDYGYYRPLADFMGKPDGMSGKVLVDAVGIVCPKCGTGHLVYETPSIPTHLSADARVQYVLSAEGSAEKYSCTGNGAIPCNNSEYSHTTAARLQR